MVRNTMSYSLGAAAAATGLNKTSILRAIKSGKISGTKDALGQWWVEPAELQPRTEAWQGARSVGPRQNLSRHVAGRGAVWHALRYGQQNPGTGCGLASSRIHGLDPHLGSLSGCRSDRSKSWPKALCPKFAGRESDERIGLRNVSPHEQARPPSQGGCHIDCGATDATASSVDLALR